MTPAAPAAASRSCSTCPRYQAVGIGHDPFRTSTGKKGNFGAQPRRLVPDIASDGDPDTGFEVLTTDPADVPSCSINGDLPPCKPKFFAIGGTSLSAPAAAAMFTDMLAAHGATAGVGDIHGALYSAYAAQPHIFRDVRSGRNGRQKDVDRHDATASRRTSCRSTPRRATTPSPDSARRCGRRWRRTCSRPRHPSPPARCRSRAAPTRSGPGAREVGVAAGATEAGCLLRPTS